MSDLKLYRRLLIDLGMGILFLLLTFLFYRDIPYLFRAKAMILLPESAFFLRQPGMAPGPIPATGTMVSGGGLSWKGQTWLQMLSSESLWIRVMNSSSVGGILGESRNKKWNEWRSRFAARMIGPAIEVSFCDENIETASKTLRVLEREFLSMVGDDSRSFIPIEMPSESLGPLRSVIYFVAFLIGLLFSELGFLLQQEWKLRKRR